MGALVLLDTEHGLAAPGGGVQAGLNPGYQTANGLELRGKGTSPELRTT